MRQVHGATEGSTSVPLAASETTPPPRTGTPPETTGEPAISIVGRQSIRRNRIQTTIAAADQQASTPTHDGAHQRMGPEPSGSTDPMTGPDPDRAGARCLES